MTENDTETDTEEEIRVRETQEDRRIHAHRAATRARVHLSRAIRRPDKESRSVPKLFDYARRAAGRDASLGSSRFHRASDGDGGKVNELQIELES